MDDELETQAIMHLEARRREERRAVEEAGGGESEGFELAEEELINNATHGGGRGDPSQDAFTPELEADLTIAVDGEADDEQPSEDER